MSFTTDLRFGLRTLGRNPAFTLIAVLTLALGIGANTAIFSVVNAVLLRPLPYKDPDRLVMVWESRPSRNQTTNVINPGNYFDWKARNSVFSDMAIFASQRVNLTGAGEAELMGVERVEASYFNLLGAQAALGRVLTAEEDKPNSPPVAVMSHQIWISRFGGDPKIVGGSVTLDGRPVTVLGVMPADFRPLSSKVDFWMPVGLDPAGDNRGGTGRYAMALARLKPGITLQRAQSEMDAIAAGIAKEQPQFDTGWGVSLVTLPENTVGDMKRPLWVLLGAVGFVLLIACANVANLLLARATGRQKEISIRAALGAGRWRVVRQLLGESILLAIAGGICGGLLAVWGIDALRQFAPRNLPRLDEVRVDLGVFAFTSLVSILTGVAFGLVPALDATRLDLTSALREGGRSASAGRRSHRLRTAFVIAEIALSMILLIGAGLMIQSFLKLQAVNPGFRAENVLTLRLSLPRAGYEQIEKRVAFFRDAVERISQTPGLDAAGAVGFLPFAGPGTATRFKVVGRPDPAPGQEPSTDVRVADSGYFRTMGIPLLRGRAFTLRDLAVGAPLRFIVNETMVRRMFPDADPVGQRLNVNLGFATPGEIVGVVGDVKHNALDAGPRPMVYCAHSQFGLQSLTLVARSTLSPEALKPAVLRAVREIAPAIPVSDVKPMTEWLSDSVARQRFQALLLGLFSFCALALAMVGIYGVMSFLVTERTREIGVRMALGAAKSDVLRMVARQGIGLVAIGVGIGLAAALALTRVIGALLFEVKVTDVATYAGVTMLLAAVALAACLIPARRAATVDPITALRYE